MGTRPSRRGWTITQEYETKGGSHSSALTSPQSCAGSANESMQEIRLVRAWGCRCRDTLLASGGSSGYVENYLQPGKEESLPRPMLIMQADSKYFSTQLLGDVQNCCNGESIKLLGSL